MEIGRIPTMDNLKKRNIISNSTSIECVFCNTCVESPRHILFECKFAHRIWTQMLHSIWRFEGYVGWLYIPFLATQGCGLWEANMSCMVVYVGCGVMDYMEEEKQHQIQRSSRWLCGSVGWGKFLVTLKEIMHNIDKQTQRNDVSSDKVIVAVTYCRKHNAQYLWTHGITYRIDEMNMNITLMENAQYYHQV